MLGRGHWLAVDGQLALAAGALLVFVLGNVSDIVTLDLRGVHSPVTLHESIWSTWLRASMSLRCCRRDGVRVPARR